MPLHRSLNRYPRSNNCFVPPKAPLAQSVAQMPMRHRIAWIALLLRKAPTFCHQLQLAHSAGAVETMLACCCLFCLGRLALSRGFADGIDGCALHCTAPSASNHSSQSFFSDTSKSLR